jgi:hypothetical protein
LLSLNYNKTQYIQFRTKTDPRNEIIIGYDNNYISNNIDTKFLGLIIDTVVHQTGRQLLKKLSKTCYTMRILKPIMSIDTLKIVYYSYFHSLIMYGIIFWGNSSLSLQVFKSQKRIIRIMYGLCPMDSCRDAFKILRILLLKSQYIYSLLLFIVNNGDVYHNVSLIHDIQTRRNLDLFQPHSHLTLYQKGRYYSGVKLFNSLPLNIKELAHNIVQFRLALSTFFHSKSFYTVEEYFNHV